MAHNTFPGNPGESPEDQPHQPPVQNIINGEVQGSIFQVGGDTYIPDVDLSDKDGPTIFQAGSVGNIHVGTTHSGNERTEGVYHHESAADEQVYTPYEAPAAPAPEVRMPGENPDKTYEGEPAHFELSSEELRDWAREQNAADLEKNWAADTQRAQQEADAMAETVLAQEIRDELVGMGLRQPSAAAQPKPQAPAQASSRPIAHGNLVSFNSTTKSGITPNRFRPVGEAQNRRAVEDDEAPQPRRRLFRRFRKPPTNE